MIQLQGLLEHKFPFKLSTNMFWDLAFSTVVAVEVTTMRVEVLVRPRNLHLDGNYS